MNIRLSSMIAGCVTLCLAGPAAAQRAGEMTLYSNPNFGGRQFTVTGQRNILNPGFTVRSVAMANGEQWQLCERRNLQRCTTYNGSVRAMAMDVQSAQPAMGTPTTRPTPLPAPLPGNGGSLRGMAAEFFPQPADRRGRVPTQGNAAAAKRAADDFCRQASWTRAAYERLETVAGRVYLADVLCVRAM